MESLVIPNVYGFVFASDPPHDRILSQKRWKPADDPDNTGRLELPGGKWRAFEPALDCLRREIEEETGLRIDVDEGLQRSHLLGNDEVQVLTPPMVVQMTVGPYPSMLVVIPCKASGTPASQGDGARDVAWYDADAVREMLVADPECFTALTTPCSAMPSTPACSDRPFGSALAVFG